MENLGMYQYGMWGMVFINILIILGFTFSVFKPTSKLEWRSMGVFSAFVVALFTEMYGFPLTIYLLTTVFGKNYPVSNPFSHLNGHLWVTLGGGSNNLFTVLHPLSNIFIFLGLSIIYIGWKGIHGGHDSLVTSGIYRYVRHPQYTGFILIITGFLIMWPTILTMLMAPVLFVLYYRLSKKEETVMVEKYGESYLKYKREVPAFFPKFKWKLK